MKYFVIEFQCFQDGTASTLTYSFDDELAANYKYHEILMYATASELSSHGAVTFNSAGVLMKGEGFEHPVEEPEVEPEEESTAANDEAMIVLNLENGDLTWDEVPTDLRDGINAILQRDVADGKITAGRYTEITGYLYAE